MASDTNLARLSSKATTTANSNGSSCTNTRLLLLLLLTLFYCGPLSQLWIVCIPFGETESVRLRPTTSERWRGRQSESKSASSHWGCKKDKRNHQKNTDKAVVNECVRVCVCERETTWVRVRVCVRDRSWFACLPLFTQDLLPLLYLIRDLSYRCLRPIGFWLELAWLCAQGRAPFF